MLLRELEGICESEVGKTKRCLAKGKEVSLNITFLDKTFIALMVNAITYECAFNRPELKLMMIEVSDVWEARASKDLKCVILR